MNEQEYRKKKRMDRLVEEAQQEEAARTAHLGADADMDPEALADLAKETLEAARALEGELKALELGTDTMMDEAKEKAQALKRAFEGAGLPPDGLGRVFEDVGLDPGLIADGLGGIDTPASTSDLLSRMDQDSEDTGLPFWTQELDNRMIQEVRLARVYAQEFNHGTSGHIRLLVVDKLSRLLDQLSEPREKPSPLVDRYVLDVPYHPQSILDPERKRQDGGPACVAMVGQYCRPGLAGAGQRIMGLVGEVVDRETYLGQLQSAMLEVYQVKLHRLDLATMETIQHKVLQDLPVIILVHYGSNMIRSERDYRGGRFLVVMGYEVLDYQGTRIQRYLVHDPDNIRRPPLVNAGKKTDNRAWEAQGAAIPFVRDHLLSMWEDTVKDRNPLRVAFVPEIL